VQPAGELKKVQRKLGVSRASLGSLSEAARVFDSALMQEVIQDLSGRLKPISSSARLDDLAGILTAVDGTLIHVLPKMTWALWKHDQQAIKAHAQFDLQKYVPVKITVTDGKTGETEVLAQSLEPGRIYVQDRGYARLALFQNILDHQSSFICRLRDNAVYESLAEYELNQEAVASGILFDKKVRLGDEAKIRNQLSVPVRVIALRCKPHRKRYKIGRGGPEQDETLLLATDRFDLEAEVIALIFKHRWAVEIFFRFFKHVLGCRHLLSYCRNGIEIQTYAAIIACMLMALWTGRKPTLRTFEMLCWYFTGMADEEELLAHIQRLQKLDRVA
jgi:hypothetical protein